MMNILIQVIHSLIYVLIVMGIWFIFSKDIIHLLVTRYMDIRFRRNKKKYNNKVYKHIEQLVFSVFGTRQPFIIYTFFILSGTLFIIFAIVLTKQSSILINILFPIILGLTPYGFLRVRLKTIRIESSYEGEFLISELLNQYKINYKNMNEAIEKTIPYLENTPYTKKLMFRLSLRLKEYKGAEELRDAINDFEFAINTDWSKLLINAIQLSIEEGTDVSISLIDIIDGLKTARRSVEEGKRNNTEGFTILKYLSPIIYFGMFWYSVEYLNFTVDKYIHLQFNTATGLKYFTMIVILTLFNIGIAIAFKRRKFDI